MKQPILHASIDARLVKVAVHTIKSASSSEPASVAMGGGGGGAAAAGGGGGTIGGGGGGVAAGGFAAAGLPCGAALAANCAQEPAAHDTRTTNSRAIPVRRQLSMRLPATPWMRLGASLVSSSSAVATGAFRCRKLTMFETSTANFPVI